MTHDNTNRRSHVLLACLLAIAMTATATVEAAFQSLPLVPHHVQKGRRRRLLSVSGSDSDLLTFNTTHAPARRSRLSYENRQLRAQQVGALYQGYGTHYIDLWCGSNPPQRQTVIVDTGSAVTAFPCSGCSDHCGKDYHIDQVFDEHLSNSFEILDCNECMRGRCTVVSGNPKNNNCVIGMSYQEGSSWTAFEARDYCYVGGPHGMPLDVVIGDKNTPAAPKKDVDKNGESTADIDPALASTHAFPLVFGCQTKLTGLFKTQVSTGLFMLWHFGFGWI